MGLKGKAWAAKQRALAEAADPGAGDANSVGAAEAGPNSARSRNNLSRHPELVERKDFFVDTFLARLSESAVLHAQFFSASTENEAKRAIRKEYGADACRFLDNTGHFLAAMAAVAEQDEEVANHWAILRPHSQPSQNAVTHRAPTVLGAALSKGQFLAMPRPQKRKYLEDNPEYNPKKGKWEPGVDHSHLIDKYG
eukprot:TRINITY_DN61940_c0_g1_i1.p1 TRINITY_DN61940_c0_g1~~TRINITY_DN61940_c0_g1_i1.p1  ORF type:complete len:196 (-),score=35.93 TRINITY_DN61940_c0_g1_i1:202-789(-)